VTGNRWSGDRDTRPGFAAEVAPNPDSSTEHPTTKNLNPEP